MLHQRRVFISTAFANRLLQQRLGRAALVVLLLTGLLSGYQFGVAAPDSIILVNTSSDVFDVAGETCETVTVSDLVGAISLREAICASNNTAAGAPHTINFGIGSGVQTITPATTLPTITRPVTIDGNSQPGYYGTPLIVLDGANNSNEGLWVTAGATTIRGLVIQRFAFSGIFLGSAGGNTIQGNYIGVDPTGSQGLGNGQGIYVAVDSPVNLIGGASAGQGNLISGNLWAGVVIDGESTHVKGNQIGTDASGTASLGNYGSGIELWGTRNTIGGTSAGERNLISGNYGSGIFLRGSSNMIFGNRIGTDASGTATLPNVDDGVFIYNASNNDIGGRAPGAGNLISGNQRNGLSIDGYRSTYNYVQGNQIGTDAAGSARLENGGNGVRIYAASYNILGGAGTGEGNLISGNNAAGIVISGSLARGNLMLGNKIGTDATGTSSLYNGLSGIYVGFAPYTIIGMLANETGNLISGNLGNGVYIAASHTTVQGNKIGTDRSGTAAVPNQRSGVYIDRGDLNLIGGPVSDQGNLISGNQEAGLAIYRGRGNRVFWNQIGTNAAGTSALGNGQNGLILEESFQTAVESNLISGNDGYGVFARGASYDQMDGNKIGTNAAGGGALPNTYGGVALFDARFNRIGTSQGNLISGNGGSGVLLSGAGATNNEIARNDIGGNNVSHLGLGNLGDGITLWNAPGNLIGGASWGQGNRIVANGGAGVQIYGDEADWNLVFVNSIGVEASGTSLGNAHEGVLIIEGDNNSIGVQRTGGGSYGHHNAITHNGRGGVGIVGDAVGNSVLQNSMFDNNGLGIDLGANGGVEVNDLLDADTGPNGRQNYPELTGWTDPLNLVSVAGTLHSAPSTTYTLDFYASASCDPSDFGESQQWVGSGQTSTDASGVSNFDLSPGSPLPPGMSIITATATDPEGNTSEFSTCYPQMTAVYLPFVRR